MGRAALRASRATWGFGVAPPLHFHPNKHATAPQFVAFSSSTKLSNACGSFSTAGLSFLERTPARQVHVLAADSSSPAVVADDAGVGGSRRGIVVVEGVDSGAHEGGASRLSELCAGKVPEYLLRR